MTPIIWLVCACCLFVGTFIGALAICVLSAGKCDRCIEEAIQRERKRLEKMRVDYIA
jgi:uncharacterized membrane-anchored protein YhcB (DUF1043 family)